MPIYEYQCEKCGCRFEKRQSFSDTAEASCPKCRTRAHRLIRPAPIIFKGSGFYVTDHRQPGSGGNGGDSSKEKTEKPGKTVAKP